MKKLIVVSDWASDSLSCQEFRSAVEGFLESEVYPHISFVASTPSTIHTAFLIQQLVETETRYGRPQETIIFQNTDPRLNNIENNFSQNPGGEFLVLRLTNGIYVCGPNSGYDFSLIKKEIDKLFIYQISSTESQFRSRDFYSRICAHLMEEMEDQLELEEVQTNIIPELQGFYIGHIDNFGNIKTTAPLSVLKGKYEWGEEIEIIINNIKKRAILAKGLFKYQPGVLIIYPGSSGKKDDPYLEISVWRYFTEKDSSTGEKIFNYPKPGTPISLTKKK